MECMELSETDNFTAQSHFVSCRLDSSGERGKYRIISMHSFTGNTSGLQK